MTEIKSAFIVYSIHSANLPGIMPVLGLVKENMPIDGHKQHQDAVEWINDKGNSQTDYTILEVFRIV